MMTITIPTIPIYLEIGLKKTAAGALEWPGWCRMAKDGDSARQALFDYAPRYAQVLAAFDLAFLTPAELDSLLVVEELPGNSTTDFGAPAIATAYDSQPLDQASLERLLAITEAGWGAFDRAVQAAAGKELRTGPRGGGRDLRKVQEHVLGAEQAYLGKLAWKYAQPDEQELQQALEETRRQVRMALEAGLRGELPTSGPRGGQVWSPRYFIRRLVWHVLDHTWEIEDRIE